MGPTYADQFNPADSLRKPQAADGMDLQSAISESGWQVMAVDWILQKFGWSLMEFPIKYISGDFEKIAENASAWENVGFAMQDIRNNLNDGWMQLEEHWNDDAARALGNRIQVKWTLALEGEAKLAQIIGRGFGVVAKASKMAAKEVLRLVKMGVDKAIEMIVAAAIPVVGWARAALILKDVIDIVWAIKSIIEGVIAIIEGLQKMWEGVKEVGSALSKLDDARNLNDVINDTNAAGRGVRDVGRGALDVAGGVNSVANGAQGVRDGVRNAGTNYDTFNRERSGDVYYGRDGDGNDLSRGDPGATPQPYEGRHREPEPDDGLTDTERRFRDEYHSKDGTYGPWRDRVVDGTKETGGTDTDDDEAYQDQRRETELEGR